MDASHEKDSHLYSMLLHDIDINSIKGRQRSRFLATQDIQKIWGVARDFSDQGLTPNYHITINFQQGIDGALSDPSFTIQPYISEFLNKMRKWHLRHKISFAYIWIVESVRTEYLGQHVHILLHSDPARFDELNAMITGWLPFERDDIGAPEDRDTNIYIDNDTYDLWGLLDYLFKGIDPRLNNTIARKHSGRGRQGYIRGPRYGYSKKPCIPEIK